MNAVVRDRPKICPRYPSPATDEAVRRQFAKEENGMVSCAIHNPFASYRPSRPAPLVGDSHRVALPGVSGRATAPGGSRPISVGLVGWTSASPACGPEPPPGFEGLQAACPQRAPATALFLARWLPRRQFSPRPDRWCSATPLPGLRPPDAPGVRPSHETCTPSRITAP
jgi:hypothetical protein